MSNFPTSLDSFSTKTDNEDTVAAADVNNLQTAVVAIETKLGINSSAVTTTSDYLLRNLPTQDDTIVKTNLNADLHDGAHASATPTANYIVIADANGFITTPSSAPTSNYQVANKKYVTDNVVIKQVVNTLVATTSSTSDTMTRDDSIPQNTEGAEFMSLAITPTSATNKLKIEVIFNGASGGDEYCIVALFQDTTASALNATIVRTVSADSNFEAKLIHYMTAGTTNETTFKVRAGGTVYTTHFNSISSGRLLGGVLISSMTITEIVP